MIKIKNMTVKNFMSVGNATQSIQFDRNDLTLVLGENLDLGSDGSRNGTGKTTIVNALSYALYGQALTNIKRDNLINKTNSKHMLVSLQFTCGQDEYRIERGRKPNVLRLFKNETELDSDDDNARGESKDTQEEIDRIIGMQHDMFKNIIALNTYTQPFLSLSVANQRSIIEQLLGITILTEKANTLKDLVKETKAHITREEYKIAAIVNANERIKSQIESLKNKRSQWERNHKNTIDTIGEKLALLLDTNIDDEITAHERLATWNEKNTALKNAKKWFNHYLSQLENDANNYESLVKELKQVKNNKCPECGQDIQSDEHHEEHIAKKQALCESAENQLTATNIQLKEYEAMLEAIGDPGDKPQTVFANVNDAHNHKNLVQTTTAQLEAELEKTDPYTEQIDDMEANAIQDVDYTTINSLNNVLDHQQFLMNLLTKKDSFIRKKIIDQNLSFLNTRLSHYLTEIGLPHKVHFLADLSVEITELGRDLDYANLSRGEMTRVIVCLCMAFRDVWETQYQPINMLFIDELVDNGLDTKGVDAVLQILKSTCRERKKSVWLVSHRDELVSRVNNTMTVVKNSGFTEYHN